MKNMRIFFEQWATELEPNQQLPIDNLDRAVNGGELVLIRQLPTAELNETKMLAFCRVGFTYHRKILRKCKTIDERWYYIIRCADEFWSVANLKNHIRTDKFSSFGRMPNNFTLTIPDEKTATIAMRSFKDEYLLDFVDIKESDDYKECDVENAIVTEVKKFIMMVGDGFCFIGNQYRLLVDEEEFFVDMLFFSRALHCLVAFELKKDKFRPADLGQLSFYLSALDKYVRKPAKIKPSGFCYVKK